MKIYTSVDDKTRGSYYHPLFRANFNHPTAIWTEDMNEWMNEWITRIGSLEPDGTKIYTGSGWQNLWPILSSSFAANF
jgi:hypothetical protein